MPGFDNKPTVPIIGQPFTFRHWWPTVLLNCNCDEKHALLIQDIGLPVTCPACKRSVMIQGMAIDPHSKQIGVQVVQVAVAQKVADA